MYKITTLDSGLKVATFSIANAQTISLGIWINAGGRYEQEKQNGISHFLEHVVFKGTKSRSYRNIKESIEGIGGLLNGFTSEEFTCFLVKILASHLEIAVDILMDLVFNPALLKNDVEKEKLVIFEEIRMYFDLPQHYAYERLMQLLWPNQPLGRYLAGTLQTVKDISQEELIKYKDSYYAPANCIIACCGNFSHKNLVKIISKINKKNKNKKTLIKSPGYESAYVKQNMPQIDLCNKKTEQTHLCLGVHALAREHPMRHALGLLNIVLGANMSSRLFNEIREKRGLAYEIGTGVKRLSDTGAFIINAGLANKKVEQTLSIILKELKKITKNIISKDEFQRAKEYYCGQLLMGLEDTLEHMLWIGEQVTTKGKVKGLRQIAREINQVKIDEIKKVAALIFRKDNLNLSLIGPLKENEKKKLEEILSEF